jgi:dTMP kinase
VGRDPAGRGPADRGSGGRWIVFEGGEGGGKSTQAARLAAALDAVLTREPGGTAIGARLRELLLDPGTAELDHRAEALLMAADRAQHVGQVVVPALESGRHVVSDRSAYSSIAYQGYALGLPVDEVRDLSDWAMRGRWPDLVVLLDVPSEVGSARLGAGLDRIELLGADFHRRVTEGFREMATADADRWVVVDGSRSIDEVEAAVREAVRERLQLTV